VSLIPAFDIGVWNAWIFMIVYPLQWLVAIMSSKRIAMRTGDPPELKQERQYRLMGTATMVMWAIASLYSIFLPLHTGTAWFYIGLAVALLGIVTVIIATVNVSRTPADAPFTGGVYRFSRHPMYLSMIMVYFGVSVAAASWLFFLITIVTVILLHYGMILEEEYCCEKFGPSYREYRDRTPRWLGIPKAF
jgi:protein-S-isoprenylcysteine O-methyltransferase Ste14